MSPPPPLPEDLRDTEHIRVLVICHYVMAGLGAACLLGLLLHFMVMKTVFGAMQDFPDQIETVTEQKTDVEVPDSGALPLDDQESHRRELAENREEMKRAFSGLSGFFGAFYYLYLVIGFFILLVVILNFLTARYMAQRRKRTFSIVVAAINCLSIPLGTILGVFTIVVLSRASVEKSYRTQAG